MTTDTTDRPAHEHDYVSSRDVNVVGGVRLRCSGCGHDPSVDRDDCVHSLDYRMRYENGTSECACGQQFDDVGNETLAEQDLPVQRVTPHRYKADGVANWRTCADCGRGANAEIHRAVSA